jgi:GAF domain-containing protein
MHQRGAQELQAFPGRDVNLEEADRLSREVDALRNRLTRMSEASLRINESLNLPTVLQEVIDSARSLTGARYGALVAFADSGEIETLMTSGITAEERPSFGELPKGLGLLQYLNEIEEPLRLADIAGHPRSVGFPKGHPPMKTFLGTPIRYQDQRLGNIYLTEKEGGREFTREDEETLVMFASQATLAVGPT